jgi:hypothetical protein
MSITVSVQLLPGYPQSVGAKSESIGMVTLTGTYTAGGFQVDPVQFGFSDFLHVEHGSGSYEIDSYDEFAVFDYDPGGIYFILHNRSDGAEVTAGQDLTGDRYLLYLRGF